MNAPDSSPPGRLYIVTTPIGNLDDMTFRALNVLREVDLILAEDTRRTRILLDHFEIRKKLESYHCFNEHGRTDRLIQRVRNGETIALVSDAGTPCIADPGFLLVREAVANGINPIIIPGVSALTFAVSASALPSDKFAFFGFPPVKSGRRNSFLEAVVRENKSCVLFESPYRMEKLLLEIQSLAGPETRIALIREATKIHEEILRGTVCEILRATKGRTWKGECVLVVAPPERGALPFPELPDNSP